MISALSSVLAAAMLLGAMAARLRSGRMPNLLFVAALSLAPMVSVLSYGLRDGGVRFGLGFGLAMLVGVYLYGLGTAKAGDVKLLVAYGALAGPGVLLLSLFITMVLGLAVGLLVAFRRGTLPSVLARVAGVFTLNPFVLRRRVGTVSGGGQVPVAALLAAGGLLALALGGAVL